MANNFIPWLGSNATASPQQANYGKIALTGFEAGGFVKAEDFNAALRMTTLVCTGIASVFGFDSLTIDDSEETITNAIQGANITLGNITTNGITVRQQINTSSISAQYINGQTINADTVTVNNAIDGGSLNINGTIQAQSITANVITGNATITTEQLNAGRITVRAGTIRGLSSTTIDTSTIEVDNINAKTAGKITIGSNIGSIKVDRLTVGDPSSHGAEITGDGNITATGRVLFFGLTHVDTLVTKDITARNIYTTDYINAKGPVRTNGVDRITSAGIMFPSKLNLKNISNCAYLASGHDVVISIGKGMTEDCVHFGAKIPELPYSTDEAQKQILLACISIEATGGTNINHIFNSVYTAILTGYPGSNQGSVIFDIYSGDGTSIGDSWGKIRVSYQPYSWFSTSNPVAPSCYIAYKKNVNFNDIITSIRVDLYPIATFN